MQANLGGNKGFKELNDEILKEPIPTEPEALAKLKHSLIRRVWKHLHIDNSNYLNVDLAKRLYKEMDINLLE